MSKNECVVLKGSGEGVNMILDPSAPISEILESVRDKIKGSGGFFKGECDVFVTGRELSKSDEIRITSVLTTVFPEANIVFPKKAPETVPEIIHRNHTNKGARFMEELIKAAEHSRELLKNDKSGIIRPHKFDVKLYGGDIKSGETLKTPGDLLVVGDVEKGAEIIAEGNVYIMGKLMGRAAAGSTGGEDCHIFAASFMPQSVTIADISKDFDEFAQESSPKMAYLMNRVIFVKKFL